MADESHTGNETTDIEVDDETRQQAEEQVAGIEQKYEPGARPTVTLPGTGGMVSGTAFADMVDENGEMKDSAEPDGSETTDRAESKDESQASA
ncbi:hypothetical protein [Rhodococcus sp. P1Y]|uniref:hypothetical protein n=1 Tax=Rhodococcus sp. P1Y TaxID=1302308 RepID=UPI000EB522AA|nr:hypothetical protein [Rhodococcus sp. P1Y]AYJ49597.1 hypothetical protein D8W71_16190 [Rhodococcus sp. P1Y]